LIDIDRTFGHAPGPVFVLVARSMPCKTIFKPDQPDRRQSHTKCPCCAIYDVTGCYGDFLARTRKTC